MAYDLVARLRLVDNMTDPLRRATAQMSQAGRVGQSSFGGLTASLGTVATNLGLVATAAGTVAAAFASVNKAVDFEAQMSSIKALTGASTIEMQQMSKLALEMGANTKYSALQAAQGIEELLKSGLTPAQVQAGGLESALNLATAGGLELADAAEIMSTALNAYRRDALTAEQASNILAGTANASATSVQELRYSLAAVSAVAAGVGMSFKDTNTALGLFANNGLKGSDAGTSLKTMLSNLQPTTKEQIKLFQKLGLVTSSGVNQFYNAKGQLKSLDEIASILQRSLGKMTDQQRMLALEMMFGADAIRAASILYREGAEGVRKFQSEMSKVSALDVAKQKMDNAKGAIEQFRGAMETLAISTLTPLMPMIKNFALTTADLIEKLTKWLGSKQAKEWGDTLATTLDIVTPLIVGAGLAWLGYNAYLKAALISQRLMAITMMANPIGLVVAGIGLLVGAGYLLIKNWDVVKQSASDLWVSLKNVFATGVNWVIGHLNRMIDAMNTILGNVNISIPRIPDVAMDYSVQQRKMHEAKQSRNLDIDGTHAGGLSRVPYDGYVARLHKNERVLTASENERYSSGGTGVTIAKLADQIIIREEADIDRVVGSLVRELRAHIG